MKHIPVLLDKVLETAGDIKNLNILDATFGAGGYSRAFLEQGANVVAFDRDAEVLSIADELKKEFPDSFEFINKPFSRICDFIKSYGDKDTFKEKKFDIIVFDFGISSMQIDNASRGFSFRFDAPLDMRMENKGETVGLMIKRLSLDEITKILRNYGDVKKARIIASAIKEKLPKTTFELKELIYNPKDIAPVFQALRIAVNDELGQIEKALGFVPELLNVDGKCICVSFQSLEDRLVKSIFRKWTEQLGDPRLPTLKEPQFISLKTFKPSKQELQDNPRARSAHLRAVVKSY